MTFNAAGAWAVGASISAVVSIVATPQAQAPAETSAVLVGRMHAYIDRYEPELSALVADEVFEQRHQFRPKFARLRRLESDIGFLRLPGGGPWLAQRSVRAIDGVAVADGGGALGAMLAMSGADRLVRARAIAEGNAPQPRASPHDERADAAARARCTPPGAGTVPHRIRVDFRADAALGMLVPDRLEERYVSDGEGRGTATYRNYRRFQTSGRVVPP